MYLPASAAEKNTVSLEILLLEERLIQARNALIEFRDKQGSLKASHPVEEDVIRSIYQNMDAIGMLANELTMVGDDAPELDDKFFQEAKESKGEE